MIKVIKKGLLKGLKNIEKNQNVNNNDKNKKTNDESVKSEWSKKTSIRDDELERSVYSPYSPHVANIEGIDVLGSKDETQTFYLKDDLEVFFLGYPDVFDSDLKILYLKKKKYWLQVTFKRNYNTI